MKLIGAVQEGLDEDDVKEDALACHSDFLLPRFGVP